MTSEEIDLYMVRGYSIECPQMVLRQNTETSPEVYEGPGSIYQTPDGELVFKFYVRTKNDFRALGRVFGPNAPEAGQIVPRDHYFSLKGAPRPVCRVPSVLQNPFAEFWNRIWRDGSPFQPQPLSRRRCASSQVPVRAGR